MIKNSEGTRKKICKPVFKFSTITMLMNSSENKLGISSSKKDVGIRLEVDEAISPLPLNLKGEYMIRFFNTTLSKFLGSARYLIPSVYQGDDWIPQHTSVMVDDLSDGFYSNFEIGHETRDVEGYSSFCLGSISTSTSQDGHLVLKGHELLLSLVLLLIEVYTRAGDRTGLQNLLYFNRFGERSINPEFELYHDVLEYLIAGTYIDPKTLSGATRNLMAQYQEIKICLKDNLDPDHLPFFAVWLLHEGYLEITAADSEAGAVILRKALAYDNLSAEKHLLVSLHKKLGRY